MGRREDGFTLVEMAVTMAVAAIVFTVGVPSFVHIVGNNRLTTQLNDLVSDLNLARSEAVKRGLHVTLCKRNTAGTGCDDSVGWGDGWLVFVDEDNDGTLDTGDGESLLRVQEPLDGQVSLTYADDHIIYTPRGAAEGFSGTFMFCDSRGSTKAKAAILSEPGRTRLAVDGDDDGIREDAAGDPLVCPS